MALSKKDLVKSVAEMNDMSISDVGEILNATLETIVEAVSEGESVQLYQFGTFERTDRKERQGRNPQTGKAITIKASHGIKFKPASSFKAEVK